MARARDHHGSDPRLLRHRHPQLRARRSARCSRSWRMVADAGCSSGRARRVACSAGSRSLRSGGLAVAVADDADGCAAGSIRAGCSRVAVLTAVVIAGARRAALAARTRPRRCCRCSGSASAATAIYLWHWPLYILAAQRLPDLAADRGIRVGVRRHHRRADGRGLGPVVPVRRAPASVASDSARRSRRFGARWRRPAPALLGGVAVIALFAFTLAGTTAAIATATPGHADRGASEAGRAAIAAAPVPRSQPDSLAVRGARPARRSTRSPRSATRSCWPRHRSSRPRSRASRSTRWCPARCRRPRSLLPLTDSGPHAPHHRRVGLGTNGPIPRGVLDAGAPH